MSERAVVRQVWYSKDRGRTYEQVDVYYGSPLAHGLAQLYGDANGWVTDGYGNWYRFTEPTDHAGVHDEAQTADANTGSWSPRNLAAPSNHQGASGTH